MKDNSFDPLAERHAKHVTWGCSISGGDDVEVFEYELEEDSPMKHVKPCLLYTSDAADE